MRIHPLRNERLRLHEGDRRVRGQISDHLLANLAGPWGIRQAGQDHERVQHGLSIPAMTPGSVKRGWYLVVSTPYVTCFTDRMIWRSDRHSSLTKRSRRLRYRSV